MSSLTRRPGCCAGAGLRVHLLPPRQPTPLLAFAIRHLSASAGIMITASHNPPADNGYKLYLADGAQIVPPADTEIEAAIRALGPLAQVPVADPGSPLITRHGDEVARAYLDAVTAPFHAPSGASGLRIVYTPLHGVAGGLALRAFEQAGFPARRSSRPSSSRTRPSRRSASRTPRAPRRCRRSRNRSGDTHKSSSLRLATP